MRLIWRLKEEERDPNDEPVSMEHVHLVMGENSALQITTAQEGGQPVHSLAVSSDDQTARYTIRMPSAHAAQLALDAIRRGIQQGEKLFNLDDFLGGHGIRR